MNPNNDTPEELSQHPDDEVNLTEAEKEEARALLFGAVGTNDMPTAAIGPVLEMLSVLSTVGGLANKVEDKSVEEILALAILADFLIDSVRIIGPMLVERGIANPGDLPNI